MRSDIERYKQQVARLDLTGVDFAAFRDDPLPAPVLRCLRYMHDVEHHTVCYLRDLLVTPAHRDPAVTTFLTLWSYEELWHGEAIGRVLAAHDEAAGAQRIEPMRRRLGRRDRFSPIVHALGSSVAGESFPALHMAWGAVNEWTTQAGYARLASRASHPVLTDLLNRIMRQEGRHVAFYAGEAEQRLGRNRRTQRLCRLALRRLWRPVGAGAMPRSEVAFMVGELFGDADGRAMARRIDQRVGRLPGLAGLHLVERAVDHYATVDTSAGGHGADDTGTPPRGPHPRRGPTAPANRSAEGEPEASAHRAGPAGGATEPTADARHPGRRPPGTRPTPEVGIVDTESTHRAGTGGGAGPTAGPWGPSHRPPGAGPSPEVGRADAA